MVINIIFNIIIIVIVIFIYYYYSNSNSKNKSNYLAYYTYFIGSDNNIAFKIPELPSEKYDCYYYTNNKNLYKLIKKLNGYQYLYI